MSKGKYDYAEDGEWFQPTHRKFKHMCCDCGLVHSVDFKVDKDGNIWTRWKSYPRATAAARRPFKFPKDE